MAGRDETNCCRRTGRRRGECRAALRGLDPGQRRPRDVDFTGAEIESCCRLAALLDLPLIEAARNIVPGAVTAGESIERLRSRAGGRCLPADRPGIYTPNANGAARPGRNVRRDPSGN